MWEVGRWGGRWAWLYHCEVGSGGGASCEVDSVVCFAGYFELGGGIVFGIRFGFFVALRYDSCCLGRCRRAGWRIIHAAAAGMRPVRSPHPLIVIAHESLTFVQPHLPTSTGIRAITHLGLRYYTT
jgi:hypothetical protein